MCLSKHTVAATIVVTLLFAAVASADKDPVTVERTNPTSATRWYDAQDPPAGLPVDTEEAGVTISQFGCTALVSGEVIQQSRKGSDTVVTVRADGIDIKLQLNVDEWIATPPTRGIVAHEDGHRIISEHFYAHADVPASQIGHEFLGRTFSASGPDATTAAQNALRAAAGEIAQRFMAAVRDPSQRVQEAYDQITGHGTKDIDEMDAIDWALKQEKGKG